jgi:hypothetical protein
MGTYGYAVALLGAIYHRERTGKSPANLSFHGVKVQGLLARRR